MACSEEPIAFPTRLIPAISNPIDRWRFTDQPIKAAVACATPSPAGDKAKQMREDWTPLKPELAAAIRSLNYQIRPHNVRRHEVGRELDTAK